MLLGVVAVLAMASCGGDDDDADTSVTPEQVTDSEQLCSDVFADGATAPEDDETMCENEAGEQTLVVAVSLEYDDTCTVVVNDYGWWTATDRTVTAGTAPAGSAACG